MEQLILVAHLLIALAIIGLILLQQGKGAEMGASFGAGASQTLFGSDGGGNVLTRATALLATAFFVTSFGLAIVAKNKAGEGSEVDLVIPALEQMDTLDSDLPVAEQDDAPAVAAEAEIPQVE
jgi:preprotein translocase subunit SecG